MIEIERIQTLQYMGSKSRMLSSICEPIISNDNTATVVDLFAGTGSVGYALSPYKKIISNDLEYYAYILNEAILNGCTFSSKERSSFKKKVIEKYNQTSKVIAEALKEEERLLQSDLEHYMEYAKFSEETPSVFNPRTKRVELKELEKLVSLVEPGKKEQKVSFPCLFLTYYANAYFGIKQCCQIDVMVSLINEIDDVRKRNVLFSALMSALSACASTTTHFAQFLKVKSKGTFKNIKEKRSQDIYQLFDEALTRFEAKGLLDRKERLHECLNMDYLDCLRSIRPDRKTVVYADPPYFKEHYSRYYHVLNTLCLYDYPLLAINPQTKGYSIGRYRTERNVSDFGKKAKVIDAFDKMIGVCADKKFDLVISYSENSLVKIYELIKLAEKRYRVRVEKVELKHSSQGRATETDQNVKEFIFFCDKPDNKELEIEKKANEIRAIKPIVDNPGGFIHNYMARKPYNVVSKIIECFTNENDTVYDPMFGSGTTLIEASKLGRNAVGSDINPIAYKLCRVSLQKWQLETLNSVIDRFIETIKDSCSEIYRFEETGVVKIIERCHFDLVGDELVPVSYWYKQESNGKLSGRKKGEITDLFVEKYNSFKKDKVKRIKNRLLIPNSRIAIKENTTVFDYFCNRNLLALDKIFSVLDSYKNEYGYEVLELIVSSAINLIKLSDKKASSQMPYWLPQKNVTSRNAYFIICQKATAVKEGLSFLDNECKKRIDDGIRIFNKPAQEVDKQGIKDGSVELILTDPPYTDQVPYLEYNQLWFKLFSIEDDVEYKDELVVSDAPSRGKDYNDFNAVMKKIIKRSASALRKDGLFVMFYHSFDLKSWAKILNMMCSEGLRYVYQIPTAAPRKSFKTVMSPRSTLDGNYLVFFVKDGDKQNVSFTGSIAEARQAACECADRIIRSQEQVTTQDLYDKGMLREAFEYGYLDCLASKYKTFAEVIEDKYHYSNGFWEVIE